MKWVSVKDRLPEEMGRYLVVVVIFDEGSFNGQTSFGRLVTVVSDFNEDGEWMMECRGQMVTHWMEIPELPHEN